MKIEIKQSGKGGTIRVPISKEEALDQVRDGSLEFWQVREDKGSYSMPTKVQTYETIRVRGSYDDLSPLLRAPGKNIAGKRGFIDYYETAMRQAGVDISSLNVVVEISRVDSPLPGAKWTRDEFPVDNPAKDLDELCEMLVLDAKWGMNPTGITGSSSIKKARMKRYTICTPDVDTKTELPLGPPVVSIGNEISLGQLPDFLNPDSFTLSSRQIMASKYISGGGFSLGYRVFQELAGLEEIDESDRYPLPKLGVDFLYLAPKNPEILERTKKDRFSDQELIFPSETLSNGLGSVGGDKEIFYHDIDLKRVMRCRENTANYGPPDFRRMAMFYPHLWQDIEPALEQYEEIGGELAQKNRFRALLGKMGTLLRGGKE